MKETIITLIKRLASSQVTVGKLAVSKLAIVATCATAATTAVVGVGGYAIYQSIVDDNTSATDDEIAFEKEDLERRKKDQEENDKLVAEREKLGLDETGNLNEEKTEEVVEEEGITQSEDGSFVDKDGNKLTENEDGTLTTATGTVVKKETLTTAVNKVVSNGSSNGGGQASSGGSSNGGNSGGSSNGGGSSSGGSTQTPQPTPQPEPPKPTYTPYTNLSTAMGAYGGETGANWNKTDDLTSRFCSGATATFFQSEAKVAANQLAAGANHSTLANAMNNKLVNGKYLITGVQIYNYNTDYFDDEGWEREYEQCIQDWTAQGLYKPTGFVSAAVSMRYDNIDKKFEAHLIVISFKEV